MGLRQQRLGNEIKDLLSQGFLHGLVNDPRLQTVTLTAVRLSGDLQIANVYYRIYDDKVNKQEVDIAIKKSSGYLRSYLAQKIKVRRIAALKFYYDDSIDYGNKIEHLLSSLN